ncbi:MAG TPA: 2-dehydropantoate 2-reductase N-terminal domain-containing protein [Kofleriaceae bacterium]|nr:2-dehydropantoate 2-reductase N-terminal domain-containing protein [Kofleriaceae bacterium]
MEPLRVLVVGAGAVGQPYGLHLQRGGAEVAFFVRDKYRAAAERGFDLYRLRGGRAEPVRLDGCAVVSRADEVAARRFDQVYLTVSSPALHGPWLAELIAAAGDATIVSLQPGPDDRAVLLAAGVSAERLVAGMITLISYAAPLPGETRFPRPGMAYFLPPMAPSPLSGPRDRAAAVVAALRAGQLPARLHPDVPRQSAFPTAILMPLLAALESAGWSLGELVRGRELARGTQAAREALAVVAATTGWRPPLGARLVLRPWLLRLGLAIARRVLPLPLEIYLREHFTKVHDQTVEFMAALVAKGRRAGVEVATLDSLLAAIAPARAAPAAAAP